MSTNVARFKYFDNSLSLFEIADFHFPSCDHTAKRNQGRKIELAELFIESEKERLKKEYPSLTADGWKTYQQLGFVSKITECDWSSEQLFSLFMLWDVVEQGREKWTKVFEKARKTEGLPLSGCNSKDHFLEKIFFWTLCCGINDALYLGELNTIPAATRSNVSALSFGKDEIGPFVEYAGRRIYPKNDASDFARKLASFRDDIMTGTLSSVRIGTIVPEFLNFSFLQADEIKFVFNILEDWIFERMEFAGPVLMKKLERINDGIKEYVERITSSAKHAYDITAPNKNKEVLSTSPVINPTFEDYLTPHGKKLLPFLIATYSNSGNKKDFAYMLFALNDIKANHNHLLNFELLSNEVINTNVNKKRLHEALEADFGNVGARQNFIKHIKNIVSSSSEEEMQLEKHKNIIVNALHQLEKPLSSCNLPAI